MPNSKDPPQKQSSINSTLKALQAELTESKEIYTHQTNKLERLTRKANQHKEENQQELNPTPITFKKSKLQKTT